MRRACLVINVTGLACWLWLREAAVCEWMRRGSWAVSSLTWRGQSCSNSCISAYHHQYAPYHHSTRDNKPHARPARNLRTTVVQRGSKVGGGKAIHVTLLYFIFFFMLLLLLCKSASFYWYMNRTCEADVFGTISCVDQTLIKFIKDKLE